MIEQLNKRALALFLSAGLSITNVAALTACNGAESQVEENIYANKYVTYMNDDVNTSQVLTDFYGNQIKTESEVIFVISDSKPEDGKYSVIAMDEEGNLYEGYIDEKYVNHLGEQIDKDILAAVSEEASIESVSFDNIPGEVYRYGLESFSEESLEDSDLIDYNAAPVVVRKDKDLDSEVLTYINPGDTFVLLPEDQDYYQGVLWYEVAALKKIDTTDGKTTFKIVEGYVNSRGLDMNDKYGYVKFIRVNKAANVKRLIKH